MSPQAPTAGRVIALLGPTNTGKTHLALTRLLSHSTGMIGFPLRLLARENYDKVVRVKGAAHVALLTGEEKIVPPQARYYLCTVESMPTGLRNRFAFVGVDEIQLCADPERGHVFTDRLLNVRGYRETMFLGADTIGPLLSRLVPEAEIETRPRFSTLTYAGSKSVSRLPPRTAVVAFSAEEVYAIAELLRRERGGAAVVLGALSPRTRNAQVALYQAGEVEYLVATDAIGMGLNMDVSHVAFAGLSKFDGRSVRPLKPAELAQVAGRAGRHRSDGTFGVTAGAPAIPPDVVERLEAHRFEPLQRLYWRNSELRFSSIEALIEDLRRPPPRRALVRPEADEDERAFEFLAKDSRILAAAHGPDAVRLLWEVCQIPDFRKTLSDAHPKLLGEVFLHLRQNEGRLPQDWLAAQVKRFDRTDGDIAALTQRIAAVRTWTYVSHRVDWLADAKHWQERTRDLEDRLSDALHEQLTLRFVDRRTSVLARRLKDRGELPVSVARSGDVLVEGHLVGRVEGFRFAAEASGKHRSARAVDAAVSRALRAELEQRVEAFEAEADDALTLAEDGRILWGGDPVGRLRPGAEPLHPRAEPLRFELLDTSASQRVAERLRRWLEAHIRIRLGPLLDAEAAPLAGALRGLVFQLARGLGSVSRRSAAPQVEALNRADRAELRGLGARLGRESVYFPRLLTPAAVELRSVLWTVHAGAEVPPEVPAPGAPAVEVCPASPAPFCEAVGYRVTGAVAVRADVLERIAAEAWKRATESKAGGAFAVGRALLDLARCSDRQMAGILRHLGYAEVPSPAGAPELTVKRRPRRSRLPAR